MKLEHDRGGDGDRLLVLLHGLGATRDVWRPMLAANRWTGSWIAPDLRGHGASAHADDYASAVHAADVAELACAAPWSEIVVLGHSMGGAVGAGARERLVRRGAVARLRSRHQGRVERRTSSLACAKMAARRRASFANKDEAIARYLESLRPRPDRIGRRSAASSQAGDGWRLACDPATASRRTAADGGAAGAARLPIHLARGAERRDGEP